VEVENELRHRDRHYAAAEALTHVGSWEMDWATQAVTWSAEAYRLYDVPAGSPVGHDLFVSRVHPDDRARVVQVVGEGMTQLKDVEFEFRVIRPDGSIRYLLGRNMITRDASGAPLRLSGISLDLTRQKEAEAALKAALLEVKTVRGYLRVCANCRRVLGKDGAWEQLEAYVRRHSEAEFSHGICPDCAEAWARSADAL
jgi:PAS domain S-box-containing protein